MSILKRFVSYYKPYRHLFYMDCVCATVLCIIDLSFPQILRWLPEGLFPAVRRPFSRRCGGCFRCC